MCALLDTAHALRLPYLTHIAQCEGSCNGINAAGTMRVSPWRGQLLDVSHTPVRAERLTQTKFPWSVKPG